MDVHAYSEAVNLALIGVFGEGATAGLNAQTAPVLTGWLLGLLFGTRHALDPDHLAAVSTIVAEQPRSARPALLGAWWGAGHTLTLVGVGGVLFAVRSEVPAWLSDVFELGVALMLLFLGVRGIRRALRAGSNGPMLPHNHGESHHHHAGPRDHLHIGRLTFARRSFLVGVVHGLAGSGALTALTIASMPTVVSGAIYIVLFGLGTAFGMAMLTGLAGISMRRLVRSGRSQTRLVLVSSLTSAILGVVWGSPLVLRLFGSAA